MCCIHSHIESDLKYVYMYVIKMHERQIGVQCKIVLKYKKKPNIMRTKFPC